jgi:hypothetical protein
MRNKLNGLPTLRFRVGSMSTDRKRPEKARIVHPDGRAATFLPSVEVGDDGYRIPRVLEFEVRLPLEVVFCPQLLVSVHDEGAIIAGITTRTIGSCRIDLDTKLPFGASGRGARGSRQTVRVGNSIRKVALAAGRVGKKAANRRKAQRAKHPYKAGRTWWMEEGERARSKNSTGVSRRGARGEENTHYGKELERAYLQPPFETYPIIGEHTHEVGKLKCKVEVELIGADGSIADSAAVGGADGSLSRGGGSISGAGGTSGGGTSGGSGVLSIDALTGVRNGSFRNSRNCIHSDPLVNCLVAHPACAPSQAAQSAAAAAAAAAASGALVATGADAAAIDLQTLIVRVYALNACTYSRISSTESDGKSSHSIAHRGGRQAAPLDFRPYLKLRINGTTRTIKCRDFGERVDWDPDFYRCQEIKVQLPGPAQLEVEMRALCTNTLHTMR